MKVKLKIFGISFLFLAFGCGGAASTNKADSNTPETTKVEKPCDKGSKADTEKPCEKSKEGYAEKQGGGDAKGTEKPCTKDANEKPCCGEGEDCCSKKKEAGTTEAPCEGQKEEAHSHADDHHHGDDHEHPHH